MTREVMSFMYVGAGGCVGAMARYGMSVLMQRYAAGLPLGTLSVNLIGCFLIGVVAEMSGRAGTMSPEVRLLLATGVCGGFTTMSSFVYELAQLVRAHEYFHAGWYGVATMAGSCVAFVAGLVAWHGIVQVARLLWS